MELPSQNALSIALKRCEAEAIHQIGMIQSHGLLIALGPAPEHRILQVSANIDRFFATTAEEILGLPLINLVGHEQNDELLDVLAKAHSGPASSHLIYSVLNDKILELQTTIHLGENCTFLEMEPILKSYDARDLQALFEPVRKALWALDNSSNVASYCTVVADLIRNLLGFDRVMVYRFAPNWDGEVIAESRIPEAISYLGNRFPAGDIPPQARQLYTRNLIRIVNDTLADTAPIVPALNPLTNEPLDLSLSRLRAFSPVHLEYLHNMDVRASMSISIMLEGQLWGLIACHHPCAAAVPPPVREMLEFVGKMISMKLSALEMGEHVAQGNRLGETMTALFRDIYEKQDPLQAVKTNTTAILDLVKAGGAVLIIDGQRLCLGRVPPAEYLEGLLAWLGNTMTTDHLATSHLLELWPEAEACSAAAAGLLATQISADMRNGFVWFRPEKLQTVNWAGRPDKEVVSDAEGELHISPRKSFAVWSEIWRHRCDAWTPAEITSGTVLAEALLARCQLGLLRETVPIR